MFHTVQLWYVIVKQGLSFVELYIIAIGRILLLLSYSDLFHIGSISFYAH